MRLPALLRPLATFSSISLLLLAACTGSGQVVGDDDGDDDDDVPGVDAGTDGRPPTSDGGGGTDAGNPDIDASPDANSTLTVCASGGQYATIGAAIVAAPDGATINVCAGTYNERLAIAKSVYLKGEGDSNTTLDAGDAGTAIALSGGANLVISGFTITRGRTAGSGGAINCAGSALTLTGSSVTASRAETGGGGIYGTACTINVDATHFTGNEGHDRGGAILAETSTGAVINSQFASNAADEGGALYLLDGDVDIRNSQFTTNNSRVRGGALYQSSDSAVENSVFNMNHSGWTGGAVYVFQHAPVFHASQFTQGRAEWEGGAFYLHQSHAVLTDNTISGNFSIDDGGGLRIFESAARLERNVISNNRADDGDGGGFKCSHVASTFVDNMLVDNWALGAGGGAEFDNDASHWSGGVISGNHASIGGGVHAMLWPWNGGFIGDVRIVNNNAWRGGGMYFENHFQLVTVRRAIISGNRAEYGGGVYTRGTPLRMSNSSVYGNTAGSVGGGFYVHASSAYPWTHECPCPPIDPAADVSFVVVDNNTADSGSAVWVNAPNMTFRNSIFTGAGTVVEIADGVAAPGWSYNDTYPATFTGMGNPTGGNGNISTNPSFMAPATGNFHLATGSACIDAAEPAMTDLDGTRADQGFYGGPGSPGN